MFCPFIWQAPRAKPTYPVVRSAAGPLLDLGGESFDEHLQAAITQEEEEQQRLVYVALTRARHRCYLGIAATEKSRNGIVRPSSEGVLARLLSVDQLPGEAWRGQIRERLALLDEHLLGRQAQATVRQTQDPQCKAAKSSGNDTAANDLQLPPRVEPQWGWRTTSFSGLASGTAPRFPARSR